MQFSYVWPYQSTQYLSALPGVAGHGLDISAGDKPSKLYFVTSHAGTKEGGSDPRGPNCFAGTAHWCLGADQGEGFHKFVLPLVGGYCYLGRNVNCAVGRGDMDYIGHSAPGAGLIIQCAAVRLAGGNNMRLWNMPSWVGDQPSAAGVTNFAADRRDCLQASMDGYKQKNVAMINCEGQFSMDESVEMYYAIDGVSLIRCAIFNPLHTPPAFAMPPGSHHEAGQDHGYGHLIGGSDFCDNSLVSQSLYAHTTDRNPLVSANRHAHVNVLHYDHGRPDIGNGAGLSIQDNGGFNAAAKKAMLCNLVGSVTVRGPNNAIEEMLLARATGLPQGSAAHAALNSCFGWPSPKSQDDFFITKPANYMHPTLRTAAWPDGFGSNYSGVLQPCAEPLRPAIQEGLAFSMLMRQTVGCMPSRRYLYRYGLNTIFDQIDQAIRGHVPTTSQWVNTVVEAGGWPTISKTSVDPKNPGSVYHAPMPLGSDRDDVLLAGQFANGASKIGYSRFRAWCIDQYFYTLGR